MSDTLVRTLPVIKNLRRLQLYGLVVVVSLIANWFIPLTYYLVNIIHNPHAFGGQRTLMDYTTGFIGDFILLPIMNTAIVYMLLNSNIKLKRINLYHVLPFGLAADFLIHFFQGYLHLTNWSMPRPYEWNFVSYWHMVSFFFQISLVFLFFYVVGRQMYARRPEVARAMQVVFGLIVLFIALFLLDYLPSHTLTVRVLAFILHLSI